MFDSKASMASIRLVEVAAHHILVVSLVATPVWLLGYVLYQRFFSPLAKVDGPFWASLTSIWKLHSFSKGDFHETIVALHQKYGPIVRIAPTEVIVSDKTAIREVYSTTHGRDYLKVGLLVLHLYMYGMLIITV